MAVDYHTVEGTCTETGENQSCSLPRSRPQTLGPAVCGDMDAYGSVVLGPDGNELCVAHAPVTEPDYWSSFAVTTQNAVDSARRLNHLMGLRPYRVFLVWVKRDRFQKYVEFRRLELMPVKVSPLSEIDVELQAIGMDDSGAIRLTNISPNQVDEDTLRGYIDGKPLNDGEKFFYEIVRHGRYPGERPQRSRFAINSKPYLHDSKFMFEIGLTTQDTPRSAAGDDQTLPKKSGISPNKLKLLKR